MEKLNYYFLSQKAPKSINQPVLDTKKITVNPPYSQNREISPKQFFQSSFYKSIQQPPKFSYLEGSLTEPEIESQSQTLQPIEEIQGVECCSYQANSQIEDSICIFSLKNPEATVVSVFDGHGGPELSKFCSVNLKKFMQETLDKTVSLNNLTDGDLELLKSAITNAYCKLEEEFYQSHLEISRDGLKEIKHVGTCGLSLIIYKNKVIVANCGDSEAIVINDNSEGSYDFKKLNERFSTSNKKERDRLIKEFEGESDIIVKEHSKSYYLKGILQPTRTLGDYYLKMHEHYCGRGEFHGPYVEHRPEITVYQIEQNDTQIILASDGLWDYLKKWQVVKEVASDNEDDKLTTASSENQGSAGKSVGNPIGQRLIDKILDKVAEQNEYDVGFLRDIKCGERRQFHDDISICVVDLAKFVSNEDKKEGPKVSNNNFELFD